MTVSLCRKYNSSYQLIFKPALRRIILLLFCFTSLAALSQTHGYLVGTVTDANSGEALIGVNITVTADKGTVTDINGNYKLRLNAGTYTVNFQYTGYQTKSIEKVIINSNEDNRLDIRMQEDARILDEIVFTASKYGKSIIRETVSVELIKARRIEQIAAADVADAIDILPGAYIMDNQLNIRGGTGFAYGAGAKTQMVVDGLTLISADRGDNKFNLVPLETLERMELIKGAASVLYGSAALNGVVHVRTLWPGEKESVKAVAWGGTYLNPKNNISNGDTLAWWDGIDAPLFGGIYTSYMNKLGSDRKLDLVIGLAAIANKSHLQDETNEFIRGNLKLRYRPNEKLNFGVSANINALREGLYLLWEDSAKLSPLVSFDSFNRPVYASDVNEYIQSYIDPFVTWFDPVGNKHKLFGRYFNVRSWYDRELSGDEFAGKATIINPEYQFYRKFGNMLETTAGFSFNYFNVEDSSLVYTSGSWFAPYLHADVYPTEKLTLSAGVRWENFNISGIKGSALPVFKGGLNYELSKSNSIRASFGEGFRFPSPAERFVEYSVGAINFLRNEELVPETGWNAELGYKHVFTVNDWKLTGDISFFVTQYDELIESVFDVHVPDSVVVGESLLDSLLFLDQNAESLLGFKFLNTGEARIAGSELSINASGRIGESELQLLGGYTYSFPGNLADNPDLRNWGNFFSQVFNPDKDAFQTNLLKYRFRHLLKMDAQWNWRKFIVGFSSNYYSFLDRIDEVLVGDASRAINIAIQLATGDNQPVPGIIEYRNADNNGDWIFGARIGFEPTENMSITLLGKNIFNNTYTIRPAKIEAPANYTLQYKVQF